MRLWAGGAILIAVLGLTLLQVWRWRSRPTVYQRISQAVSEGDLEATRELSKEIGPDMNRMAFPPLVNAAARGNLEMVRLLVEHGAQVEVPAKGGGTALEVAAREGHREVVRYLLARGADVQGQSPLESPLILASRGCHADVVELLLQAGARVRPIGPDGKPRPSALDAVPSTCEAVRGLLERHSP